MANKTAEPVYISFRKLENLLEKQGKKWQFLRDSGISPGIVGKMKDGSGHTDTRTIQKVCLLLNCQPGDIMEYVPNEK
jgi:DNA-binding Xre family transcriptional regulator